MTLAGGFIAPAKFSRTKGREGKGMESLGGDYTGSSDGGGGGGGRSVEGLWHLEY